MAEAAKRAIADHWARAGLQGVVRDGKFPSTYKVDYAVVGQPLVSIIIPTYEHIDDLRRCLESIYAKTAYPHFELCGGEHSKQPEPLPITKRPRRCTRGHGLCSTPKAGSIFPPFVFGRRGHQRGRPAVLNNDTEVINPEWMEELLQVCQLPGVARRRMLYYPDDTVQHAGVVVGLGGYAGHSHKYAVRGQKTGNMFRQAAVQELQP